MKRLPEKQLRDIELRGLRRITAGQVHHRAPAWSPDGRWLCLEVGDGAGSCWLVCDSKGRPARVLEGPAAGGASFGTDGSLAYGRRVGATLEIWQLDSGGPGPRQLLGGDGRLYRDPAWSPDGRRLCYAADEPSDGGGVTRLWLYDPLGGRHAPLAGAPGDGGLRFGRPAWAPEGDRLYFEAADADGTALFVLDLDDAGSGPLRLTAPGERCRRPAPLGGDLVVVERELPDGTSELVLLDHGGEGAPRERRLTERARCAREPALSSRKGELHLACAMLGRLDEGEPQRYDVYTGRLEGLPRKLPRRRAGGEREAARR